MGTKRVQNLEPLVQIAMRERSKIRAAAGSLFAIIYKHLEKVGKRTFVHMLLSMIKVLNYF